MSDVRPSLDTLVCEAVEIADADARAAYLDRACGDDRALRRQAEVLVAAHFQAGSFLEQPARPPACTAPYPPALGGAAVAQLVEGPGACIGPYKLLERIGEGGMGLVYVAEQQQPIRRRVALKVIKPGMDSRQVIARFEAERQALAMMDHPNIAKVLDAGATPERRPFFVMEFVKGTAITDYCDRQRLTTRQRLELFLDVCSAVQHAHQKGVIHRDLKPSNILVEVHDVRPVVKVIDFGIAKATGQQLTEKAVYTGVAQLVGTPLYMSPEQAGLSSLDVDTRSDVYALGVLLYELLTGTTPFDSETLKKAGYDEMRRIIREEEPPRPSTRVSTLRANALSTVAGNRGATWGILGAQLRGEIDWIVMKCLEKDRNRRYDTTNALALDVQRFLSDEPVQACPPSVSYRVRKFARRNRAALLTAGVLAVALLSGTAVSIWQAVEANAARRLADDRLESETRAHGEMATELYWSLLRQSSALRLAREPGYRKHVWRNLHQAVALDTPAKNLDDVCDEVMACLSDPLGLDPIPSPKVARVPPARLPEVFRGMVPPAYEWAVSPDGRLLARAERGENKRPGSRVELLDPEGRVVRSRPYPVGQEGPLDLKFSPDGSLLIAGTSGGLVIWSVPDLTVRGALPGQMVYGVAVHPNSHLVAAWGQNGRFELWSLRDNRLVSSFPIPAGIGRVEFSADGELMLGIGKDGRAVMGWPVVSTPEVRHLPGHRGGVPHVAFSPDGGRLATAGKDKLVRVWDARSGGLVHTCSGHEHPPQAVDFSPDGRRLASADFGGVVKVWDVSSGRELATAVSTDPGLDPDLWSVRFDPTGRYLAAGSRAGTGAWAVRTTPTGVALEQFVSLPGVGAMGLAIHPGGTDLVLQRSSSTWVVGYDLARAAGPRVIARDGRPGHLLRLHFSPAGDRLLYNTAGGSVAWSWPGGPGVPVSPPRVLLDVSSTTADFRWADGWYHDPRRSGRTDPLGRAVTPGGGLYDLAAGRPVLTMPSLPYMWSVHLSPDGARLAYGLADGRVEVWDLDQVRARLAEFGIDMPSTRSPVRPAPPARPQPDAEFERMVALNRARRAEVRAECRRLLLAEQEEKVLRLGTAHAATLDGLAWRLATAADPQARDPALAVEWGKKAVELEPMQGNWRNTLGVAHYRNGEWKEAIAALNQSMKLRKELHHTGFWFLAMAHWQLGEKGQARAWYDKGVAWMDKHRPEDEGLRRFRAEASALLGINDPPTLRPKQPADPKRKPDS